MLSAFIFITMVITMIKLSSTLNILHFLSYPCSVPIIYTE